MKKLLFIIAILGYFNAFSQQAKLQITSVNYGSNSIITITGVVSDELSKWGGTDFAAGDYLYFIDGSDIYEVPIDLITSVSWSTITFQVTNYIGMGAVTTGQAALVRRSPNKKLPKFVSGLRNDLESSKNNLTINALDFDYNVMPEFSDDKDAANNGGFSTPGLPYRLKANNPYGRSKGEVKYFQSGTVY